MKTRRRFLSVPSDQHLKTLSRLSAGTQTQTHTYCYQGEETGSPTRASSCRSQCVHAVEDTLSSFAGAPISHFEDVWLLGTTFVRLPAQAFYVKKAVVLVVAQLAPAYAAGGGGSEKLLGPFDILDDQTEEVEVRTLVYFPYRFGPLTLDQQLTPQAAWTMLAGDISSEGGAVEAQCAPRCHF